MQGATGTQGISYWLERDGMGGLPTQPKLASLQNPDTPLYLEKLIIYPLCQRQYEDVTILLFASSHLGHGLWGT